MEKKTGSGKGSGASTDTGYSEVRKKTVDKLTGGFSALKNEIAEVKEKTKKVEDRFDDYSVETSKKLDEVLRKLETLEKAYRGLENDIRNEANSIQAYVVKEIGEKPNEHTEKEREWTTTELEKIVSEAFEAAGLFKK